MIRSSFVAQGLGLSLLILAAACGGDKPPPPVTPDTTASAAADAAADMPSTSSTGDAGAATADTTPPPPAAPAKLDLPAASAKIKFKGKDLELKADGTVNTAGKPTGKITGMELDDKDGKAALKVDGDGNITMGDGSAYAKFDGDDLSAMNGYKWSIGDADISQTDDKGKKTSVGKADGVGTAKKASLLVVAWNQWGTKPPALKGAAPAGGKKPVTTAKPKP